MIVVSDTSSITYLIQIEKQLLLKQLFNEIIIPPAVFDELNAFEANQSAIAELLSQEWLKVKTPALIFSQPLRYKLDKGELEALALALEVKADYIIIDERRGAAVANDLQLYSIGLIGILIAAKKQGLITAVKPLLDKIINQGFYLTERFYKSTLQQINE